MALLFSDKGVLIAVTLIGFAMCSVGIGRVAAHGAWLHPLSILAYMLGALVLVIVGAALWSVKLPWIDSARAATYAVIALAIVKIALTQLHRIFA